MELELLPESPRDRWKPPPYGKPGRILVLVQPGSSRYYRWEYEILDYDADTSVFWLNEGGMFEYEFEGQSLFTAPGVYLIERAVGTYYRGDWSWGEDDDEEWEFSQPIPVNFVALDAKHFSAQVMMARERAALAKINKPRKVLQ